MNRILSPITKKNNDFEDHSKYWKPQIEEEGLFNWWD
jgi:hypothetical protein